MEGWQEMVCLWNLVGGGWREGEVWAYMCISHVLKYMYVSHVQMYLSHVQMCMSHVWMYIHVSHIHECTCSYCVNVLYVHICVLTVFLFHNSYLKCTCIYC